MILLNHAANGLMPDVTVQTITAHLQAEQRRSPHLAALDAAPDMARLYVLLAEMLACAPEDLALTTGNSHGWTALMASIPWQRGDKVLVAPGEWGGNVAMLQQLHKRHGLTMQTLPCRPDGMLDLSALEQLLASDDAIRVVALTWVPANGSTIYAAEAVGTLCAAHGVTYVVDAAQAVGALPVSVQRLQCDALTAPGRKWLNGPRGTGLLYVHPRLLPQLQPVSVDHFSCPITANGARLRSDARRFELSERSLALYLGWKAALEVANISGWAQRYAALAQQAQALRQSLQALAHVTLQEHASNPPGNPLIAFTVAEHSPQQVQTALLAQGVSVAVSSMGYTPLDMQARQLDSVVRASVGWQTSEADLQGLVTALQQLAPAIPR